MVSGGSVAGVHSMADPEGLCCASQPKGAEAYSMLWHHERAALSVDAWSGYLLNCFAGL
jgi:hypothetical protein